VLLHLLEILPVLVFVDSTWSIEEEEEKGNSKKQHHDNNSIGRSTTGNKVTTSTAATILTLAFTLALESNETLPPLQEAEHAAAASASSTPFRGNS
jgi:hypothetical protein